MRSGVPAIMLKNEDPWSYDVTSQYTRSEDSGALSAPLMKGRAAAASVSLVDGKDKGGKSASGRVVRRSLCALLADSPGVALIRTIRLSQTSRDLLARTGGTAKTRVEKQSRRSTNPAAGQMPTIRTRILLG